MTSTSSIQNVWAEIFEAAAARFPRSSPLLLGGRGSAMSTAQLGEVSAKLMRTVPGLGVRIVPIKVGADTASDRPPVEGKRIYTDNIDAALLSGDVRAAVHCEKDLDGEPAEDSGIITGCRLERGNVCDALVSRGNRKLEQLPPGAVVGTSAPRRVAQLRALRPDLEVRPIKGNIDSRIACLDSEESAYDALLVSWEGLCRLRLWSAPAEVLNIDTIAPPVGAAVVTVQTRTDDQLVRAVLDRLNHTETQTATTAERAMLAGLQGDCSSPISGHCTMNRTNGELTLTGKVFAPDGSQVLSVTMIGAEPHRLGHAVAADLAARGASEVMAVGR